MTTAFITHADCAAHRVAAGHPECPERLDAINDRLRASGLEAFLQFHDAPMASESQLLRVHAPTYVRRIRNDLPDRGTRHLDPDTVLSPGSLRAALRAAGAGVQAVDLIMTGQANNAFCAVRPPGHHAEPDRAMGFCLFNNIAIAAMHALAHHALDRVAVIDFDIHHGNGSEAAFAGDARVLMVGLFQHPFFPYSGADSAAKNMCNVPVPAGTKGVRLREIVTECWMPALRAHQPQMLFVSAGFDGHLEDDMASCAFVEADYAWLTAQLTAFSRECCGGRMVSMLEGGYALSALGRSVETHVREMAGL